MYVHVPSKAVVGTEPHIASREGLRAGQEGGTGLWYYRDAYTVWLSHRAGRIEQATFTIAEPEVAPASELKYEAEPAAAVSHRMVQAQGRG